VSTQLDFHVGVDNKLVYAARVVRKARMAGHRVALRVSADERAGLEDALWALAPAEFLAHLPSAHAAAAQCAILLCDEEPDEAARACSVLINLKPSVPEGTADFARVIEIVGTPEDEKQIARNRYKHYRDQGYALNMHSLDSSS
jgi:DNA polymerase III subunit chi